MLTYHHYLLSGFAAVSCAISACFSVSVTPPQNLAVQGRPIQNGLQALSEPAPTGKLKIAYRGSGRLDDEPVRSESTGELTAQRSSLAHRGSGRVHPQLL